MWWGQVLLIVYTAALLYRATATKSSAQLSAARSRAGWLRGPNPSLHCLHLETIDICGIVILVLGINSYMDNVSMADALDKHVANYHLILILICALGGIIIVVGLCGFVYACQDTEFVLMGFQALLAAILIFNLILGCYCFWYRNTGTPNTLKNYRAMVDQYVRRDNASYRDMSTIQFELKCCGYDGPDDFQSVPDDAFPPSCCSAKNETCSRSSTVLNKTGCKKPLDEAVRHFTDRMGGMAVGAAILAGVGLLLTLLIEY